MRSPVLHCLDDWVYSLVLVLGSLRILSDVTPSKALQIMTVQDLQDLEVMNYEGPVLENHTVVSMRRGRSNCREAVGTVGNLTCFEQVKHNLGILQRQFLQHRFT